MSNNTCHGQITTHSAYTCHGWILMLLVSVTTPRRLYRYSSLQFVGIGFSTPTHHWVANLIRACIKSNLCRGFNFSFMSVIGPVGFEPGNSRIVVRSSKHWATKSTCFNDNNFELIATTLIPVLVNSLERVSAHTTSAWATNWKPFIQKPWRTCVPLQWWRSLTATTFWWQSMWGAWRRTTSSPGWPHPPIRTYFQSVSLPHVTYGVVTTEYYC